MKTLMSLAATVMAAMLASQTIFAEDPKNPSDPAPGAQPAGERVPGERDQNKDQKFIREATSCNMLEIQLAQLAQERIQNEQIKRIAKKVQDDHAQANEQLAQIAQSKKWEVPKQLNEMEQSMLSFAQKQQGKDFEKCYVYSQLAGHIVNVLKFRDASQELQDPQLKQFATETLPKLQAHLQEFQKLANWPGNEARPAGSIERGTGTPDRPGTPPGDRPGTDRPGGDRQVPPPAR